MSVMEQLFADGAVADAVLVFLLLEALAVVAFWLWKKRGIAPADFLPGMCSGALMLLALRAVQADASWVVPMSWLMAAGAAHLVDVVRRWRN